MPVMLSKGRPDTMSINIEKIIESLPENLTFNVDTCQITSKQNLGPNTTWGPYDVEKFMLDLSQIQIWGKIKILNFEWVNFLVEKSTNKLLTAAKLHISDNEKANVTITFNKKDFQVTISTNEDIDIGSELKCNIIIIDQSPNKSQSQTDSPTDCDQNNEKLSKACNYCGINFSHQCTLDAHMTYYCSKRQNLLTNTNINSKCQKTWRTRQRNKQPNNNQKVNSGETSTFDSNIFTEDTNPYKKLRLNTINGSEAHLNSNASPNISHPSSLKKAIISPTTMTNGNSVNAKLLETERATNPVGSNSDSEPENGNANPLGFCEPCGLFFSSKELYNIHIQLDVTNFQSSLSKCNSLVLAAPVLNNNGLQYVPIHPRTAVINTSSTIGPKAKHNNVEEHGSLVPLDLSINSCSKSPTNHLSNDRVPIDVANRIAAVPGVNVLNCNHILRSNKRPFLCQHCQTRFQLYSTFQAHQEFYCQGKRPQVDVIDKLSRTTSNNSCQNDNEISALKNDDVSWKFCNQGFKCEGCGFIGQTKRGIRIHCKNQCFKRLPDHKSESKCDEMDTTSPTSDLWTVNSNVPVTISAAEPSELCHQDSTIKTESG